MFRALLRKGIADLRTRPGQTALQLFIVASAAMILMLAVSVEKSIKSSFDRAHDEAHGAHVWFEGRSAAAAQHVASHPDVVGSTEALGQVRGALLGAGEPEGVVFLGVASRIEGISPAVVTQGQWLADGVEHQVVVTRGMAGRAGLEVGDVVEATTASAGVALTVVGIAIDTSHLPYPYSRPGVAFVAPSTVDELAGAPLRLLSPEDLLERRASYVIGVRITRPAAAAAFAEEAGRGVDYIDNWLTWLVVRDNVAAINDSPVVILRLFSFFGLLGAGIIVASAITGHVLAQIREVGMLKATGFSPRHISLMFLGQQLIPGLAAAVVGVALAALAAPLILDIFAEVLYSGVSAELRPLAMGTVVAGVGAIIVVFTLLPAWRAGRTSTVLAISGRGQFGSTKPSRIARLAIRLRLPHVVVFAIKDVFARKARAWLTVAAVAVVTSIAMMTLTFFGLIDRITNDPVSLGAWPYELKAERLAEFGSAEAADGYFAAGTAEPISPGELEAMIASSGQVEASIRSWETWSRVEEIDLTIGTFIMQGAIEESLFPLEGGRMFSEPGEAVIGLGLAERFNLEIGDKVTVEIPLPTELTVVGIWVSEINQGGVLMYSADSISGADDAGRSGTLNLKLASGVDPAAFSDELIEMTGGRVMVINSAQGYQDSVEDVRAIVPLMLSLNGILIVLASANMLISVLFAVRERTREFGIMKTVGFTPGQIVFTVIAGAAALAVIGVIIGVPIGFQLTRFWMEAADTDGMPSDLVQLPGLARLALMVPLAAGLAAIGAALPARYAAGITVKDALRAE